MKESFEDGSAVRATVPAPPGRGRPKSSGGRVCEYPGCGTMLSVYNPSGACWSHQDGSAGIRSERFPGPRRRADAISPTSS
jgi:hypothetical protein